MESMSLALQQFPGVKDHSVSTKIVAAWRPVNEIMTFNSRQWYKYQTAPANTEAVQSQEKEE